MLMRTDPFRDLDRLAEQLVEVGTAARPAVMAMDAWRENDAFVVEFDLPGVRRESLDIDVDRNVLTVRADRPQHADDVELIAAERPTGAFSRQLVLGENLDLEHVKADYEGGVLRLRIPVAAEAKPRKISITTNSHDRSGDKAHVSS